MSAHPNILIIGAGPTGLGAAWRVHELGHRAWKLIDASPEPGGLAGSFVDDHGFTWGMGGHVLFSHYENFDRLMDELLGDACRGVEAVDHILLGAEETTYRYPSVANARKGLGRKPMQPLLDSATREPKKRALA